MKSKNLAVVFSVVMVLSCFAGCIDTEEETTTETVILGNVMVSTYHVEQLVSAVAGDSLTVEIISPSNVPVHDYEPSVSDLIRLQDADLFFYHGLNLEPWVDTTIASMGSDAPLAIQTHAMPSGEDTLDYQTMLLSELCEHLNDGPNENVVLSEYEHKASDVTIHAEHVNHKISFPEMDEDDHDGHDHDDHGDEDDHDGHDHEGHNHAGAEKVIEAPTDCPTDTLVSIFHLEEGEYVLEFEYEQSEDFDMVVLKMSGGHAHHDHHGHGEHSDEGDDHDDHEDNEENHPDHHDDEPGLHHHGDGDYHHDHDGDDDHTHAESDRHHDHDEHEEDHCEDDHEEEGHDDHGDEDEHDHSDEDDHDEHDHDEHGHDDHEESEEISAACVLEEFDTNQDSHLSWDEFWHAWTDVEDGHDDHDNLGNATLIVVQSEWNSAHPNYENLNEISKSGQQIDVVGFLDQKDNYETATQEDANNYAEEYGIEFSFSALEGNEFGINSEDIEELPYHAVFFPSDCGNMNENQLYIYGTDHDTAIESIETWIECTYGDNHDGHGDDEDDHDHGDSEEGHSTEEEMAYLMDIFNEADEDNDELLNLTELDNFIHMVDADDHAAYATIHIEEEGDYGFALSPGIEFFILMDEDAHEGHDHGAHEGGVCHNTDTHENYDSTEEECGAAGHMWMEEESHDDHDSGTCHNTDSHENYDSTEAECEAAGHMWTGEDEIVAGDDEEAFDYDPHSWLSPVAYKAQISVVLDALVTAFPDGEETFKANAEAYSVKLELLDADYNAAFGEGGSCTANKKIIANHNAYAYMSQRYDIEIVTVHGLDPEGEPSAEDIAEVVEQISEEGITVLYVEEYTDQSAVSAIVDQTGVTVEILYTMELPPKDSEDTYLSLMEKNLASLVAGMGC